MVKHLAASLLLALPSAPAASFPGGIRLGLGVQTYPLLPSFFEPVTKRFYGLSGDFPILPGLTIQAGISNNFDFWDLPYNDVSNYHSHTFLLRLGAEYQVFHAGPARLFLGASLLRMTSSWEADDRTWEDPDEPREFWEGRFSHWALEGAPRLELFRENQRVDWTLSLALPCYLAFATDIDNGGKALAQRFREDYVNDAGLGVRLDVGIGFGL